MFLKKSPLVPVALCLLTSLTLAQNAAAPAQPPAPLLITATPDAPTLHPGDTLKLDVTIKNISKDPQTIRVPNIIWAATTDVPQIIIPGWPARGGIGPVVIFKPVTIAPGDSYQHTWNANVSPTADPADITLHIAVPLDGPGGNKTLSQPLTLKIVPKDSPLNLPATSPNPNALAITTLPAATSPANTASPNPLYTAWQNQQGKSVTFNRTESMSGGALIPGATRAPTQSVITYSLSDINADRAIIKVTRDPNAPPELLTIPATLLPTDPALPKPQGKEDIKIGNKTYACTKFTCTTLSPAEVSQNLQGQFITVTLWLADGIPGGIIQREISISSRVSFNITDTLQPNPAP